MWQFRSHILLSFGIFVTFTSAGISPIHDLKEKMNTKLLDERFLLNSPGTHKVLKHLDNSIAKSTKNVTQNPQMDVTLYQISKDLVSAILSKLEIQDKITRITREALEAPGKNKGLTAIETRRILDYISRTLSGHMVSITKVSTEPELHRLVYGLAQIAAEVSIVSALKDITYASALSKKQSVDLSLRRKRSTAGNETKVISPTTVVATEHPVSVYSAILNKTLPDVEKKTENATKIRINTDFLSPFSVLPRGAKSSVRIINHKHTTPLVKGFLNQTALDIENENRNLNESDSIVLEKDINGTQYVTVDSHSLNAQDLSAPVLMDDWLDSRDSTYKSGSSDLPPSMDIESEGEDELTNDKKSKAKQERLEVKAKKAILYAGDVAYLTAASVVAMRRALTASIEVQMSVKYAKNAMSNHQDLMMNLAKTAAQQAGKEAKGATSKSLACERVIKLALKYTAQSYGANLNHVANRIVMDSLSLATLAKSMAFVASDIAINSLYEATDVKPPS